MLIMEKSTRSHETIQLTSILALHWHLELCQKLQPKAATTREQVALAMRLAQNVPAHQPRHLLRQSVRPTTTMLMRTALLPMKKYAMLLMKQSAMLFMEKAALMIMDKSTSSQQTIQLTSMLELHWHLDLCQNTKQPGANSGRKKKASCAGTKRARKSKEPSITKDTNGEYKICKNMEHVQVLKHCGHKRFQSMVCICHKQFGGEEQSLHAADAFLQLCIDGYSREYCKEQLGWAIVIAEYLKLQQQATELG